MSRTDGVGEEGGDRFLRDNVIFVIKSVGRKHHPLNIQVIRIFLELTDVCNRALIMTWAPAVFSLQRGTQETLCVWQVNIRLSTKHYTGSERREEMLSSLSHSIACHATTRDIKLDQKMRMLDPIFHQSRGQLRELTCSPGGCGSGWTLSACQE